MTTMTSQALRQKFLDYFNALPLSHTIVKTSSLVPHNDKTLLFTNAGMVQFKDVFLGLEKKPYTRAVSAQRCVRAGGKHNDLENVGYTARHHTFFEMLGNFSFGDYFKEQAIMFAWDFLTNHLKLPKEKLWITVYEKDEESEKIWREKIGLSQERIIRCGEKDNFWSMGDTGPCGPCSEIFYDHGESIWGGLPNSPEADGDRYIEIWNLVFMQYQRHADGTLTPLPKPSVDTGMGLERMAAVLQGVHSNYETDIFKPLIESAKKLAPKTIDFKKHYQGFCVLADHIRSSSFLIADGVIPSNEGRGYVLRRIIRRAIRHGYQMQLGSPFFYKLLKPLVDVMGDAYPELLEHQSLIEKTLKREEEQFMITLEQGLNILDKLELNNNIIPGDLVFKLYDTFGFPVDLTADIARERKWTLELEGFEKAMEKQRAQSKSAQKFDSSLETNIHLESLSSSSLFTGYEVWEEPKVKVEAVLKDGLILEKTPFYAESGGQMGDRGEIKNQKNIFIVHDTRKVGQHIVHYGEIKSGEFKVGDSVEAKVDIAFRKSVMLNHTATHLLHAALRKILGEHVQQKGSLVAADKLRFDFSHSDALKSIEIESIEKLVNQAIRDNYVAEKKEMAPDKAIASGAMALFGEKYGESVRTLKLGDFSYEVCGGTHVNATGEIGLFKIISETGIAQGVRRIEALTGEAAFEFVLKQQKILEKTAQMLKAPIENMSDKLEQLLEQQKENQKIIEKYQQQYLLQIAQQIIAKEIVLQNGVNIISKNIENTSPKLLRETMDLLKSQLKSAVILLGSVVENKAHIILGVTKELTEKYPADQLIKPLAELINGKGGGRADLAQAGGDKTEKLSEALKMILRLV